MKESIDIKRSFSLTTTSRNSKAFTLVEVLVVLAVTGLTFSLIATLFYSSTANSLNLIETAQSTKAEATLLWNLQRKISSSQEILLEGNRLHMITGAGDYFEGVVKCSYIFRNGTLFYYEFPYPFGEIAFVEEDRLIYFGTFKEFKVLASKNQQFYQDYRGKPDYFKIQVNGKVLIVKPM